MSRVALESLVLSSFRQYYSLLVMLREEVESDPWAASAGALPDEVGTVRKRRLATIQGQLVAMLQRLEAEARRLGGERAGRRLHEAGYLMSALADETFLTMDWEGRELWSQSLMESRLYGTHMAGEQVFDRAETLLRERDDREMAALHLLALSLGFEGQFRGAGSRGTEAIEELKGRLLAFVGREGGELMAEGSTLFPQAYLHTLEGDAHTRLPKVATWTIVLIVVAFAFLVASHLVWLDASGAIREFTEGIDWQDATGGSGP